MMTGSLVPEPVTAIDLFAGALMPGLMLVGMFIISVSYTHLTLPTILLV